MPKVIEVSYPSEPFKSMCVKMQVGFIDEKHFVLMAVLPLSFDTPDLSKYTKIIEHSYRGKFKVANLYKDIEGEHIEIECILIE